MILVYHIRVRLLHVCSSVQLTRQCEGLQLWNEQQVWLSRFFCIMINANEESPAAQDYNMCKELRKVTFCLRNYEFIPNATSEENAEMEELSKERIGYFHRWADYVDTSKDIPYIKTMALVEDDTDGKVYMVEYQNLIFSKE